MNYSLSKLGEFGLINELQQILPAVPEGWVGIGDDCAIIPYRSDAGDVWQVITTDSLVEGIHFRKSTSTPFAIGWKLLAISISDICAMAAKPLGAVVSIQLPPSVEIEWVKEFYRGMTSLAKRENIAIVGGNTVKSTELSFCLTAWGTCGKPPVRRRGAVAGDDLWVSGEIGGSFLGLQLLEQKLLPDTLSDRGARLIAKHTTPVPRTELSNFLSKQNIAHAMIDISDGLLQDAQHLARAGLVDLVIDLKAVPLPTEAANLEISMADLLSGGEDFELLFTAAKTSREEIRAMGGVTLIGSVRESVDGGVCILERDTERPVEQWLRSNSKFLGGFDHFLGP